MERARATWTDERLDDLARRMDDGFNRVDADLRAVNARIDARQRTLVQVGGGMIAAFVAGFLGLIATQL
ncbi:MAG TPA: hypothetical protein VI122_03915 [Thermoleophilaceae bacterium]